MRLPLLPLAAAAAALVAAAPPRSTCRPAASAPALPSLNHCWLPASPHHATDIVVVPAALSAAFHAAWIVALPVAATASGAWPGACASEEGRSYK